VAAIEIDRDLARDLRARFATPELALLERSVLDVTLDEVAALLEAPGAALRVVGNLPYNVSKPVADKLVRERARVARAVLMFQREVASRLTAAPGGRDYGPLTVLVGAAFAVERAFDLAPTSFRPPPRVVSTVTLWTPRAEPLGPRAEAALRAALRAGFAQRRRTLRNNLGRALGEPAATALLRQAEIDGELRAEAVAPAGWRRLSALWPVAP
jgi:16S rRNA (adenine1518-N6/adenine1519-N6)-dimethyltransferase